MAVPISCEHCMVGKHTPYKGLHARGPAEITALRHQIKTVPARQLLFREGEVPANAYTLYSGWAFRYCMLPDGKRQILSFHIPGDFLPMLGLAGEKLSCSVRTLTSVELCVFDAVGMCKVMGASELTRQSVINGLTEQIYELERRLTDVARRSALTRLARFIADLEARISARGGTTNGVFDFPLRQEHLADALGLTTVHVNRTLARLRKESVIRLERQRMEISDLPRLRELAMED